MQSFALINSMWSDCCTCSILQPIHWNLFIAADSFTQICYFGWSLNLNGLRMIIESKRIEENNLKNNAVFFCFFFWKLIMKAWQWRSKVVEASQKQSQEPFNKKAVHKTFAKFIGRCLCQSPRFHKVADARSATLLKSRFWLRCFPVNFTKFLKTPFLQSTCGRLLLATE